MCANDQLLFFAKESKTRDSQAFWAISDRMDTFDPAHPSYKGELFHGKKRFWLRVPGAADDEFGFSFYDTDGKIKPRCLRVVVPRTRPYTPVSPDVELAKLAKHGTADPETFITYHSKFPVRNKEGKMVLRFGEVFVIASVKNFIIEDADENLLFMIYRSSSATCTVKIYPPMSPLWAFAWALAIVTTDR